MAFPLSVTQYLHLNMSSRSAKKEENQQEGSRCRRKMVNFDHAAPSQSLSVYFEQMTKNMYHCKDSRKIYLLSLSRPPKIIVMSPQIPLIPHQIPFIVPQKYCFVPS